MSPLGFPGSPRWPSLQEIQMNRCPDFSAAGRTQHNGPIPLGRLNRSHPIQPGRHFRYARDIRHDQGRSRVEIKVGWKALPRERVSLSRLRQAEMEIRAHLFQSHHIHMPAVPGRVMPPAVREPKNRLRQNARVLQGEPDIPLLWKRDGRPPKGRFGITRPASRGPRTHAGPGSNSDQPSHLLIVGNPVQ